MRPSLLVVSTLSVAVAAGAQEAPSPARAPQADTIVIERRSADGRDVERDVTIRRGAARGWPAPMRAMPPAPPRRSAIGVAFGEADTSGLRVARVLPESPAARAGLTADDRIVAVNGVSLRLAPADVGDPVLASVPARRLERTVGRLAPGSALRLTTQRGRAQRTVALTTVAPAQLAGTAGADGSDDVLMPRVYRFERTPGGAAGEDRLAPVPPMPPLPPLPPLAPGAARAPRRMAPLPPERRAELEAQMGAMRDSARARAERRPALGLLVQPTGGARDTLGLFVASVTSGGPAEQAGIVEGDRIASIGGVDVRVPRDEVADGAAGRARAARFTRELQKAKPGDEVALRVYHDGQWRDLRARAGRASEVLGAGGAPLAFEFRALAPARRLPGGFPM